MRYTEQLFAGPMGPHHVGIVHWQSREPTYGIFLRPFDGARLELLSHIELRANQRILWSMTDGFDMETGQRIPCSKMIELFRDVNGPPLRQRPQSPVFIDFRRQALQPDLMLSLHVTCGPDFPERSRLSALVLQRDW